MVILRTDFIVLYTDFIVLTDFIVHLVTLCQDGHLCETLKLGSDLETQIKFWGRVLVVVELKEDFLSIDWRLSGNFEKKGNVTSGDRNQTFSSFP